MLNKFLIVIVLLGLSAVVSAGDLYKWTDEKGVIHYSDTPPPKQSSASRVRVKSGVSDEMETVADADANKAKDAKPTPAAANKATNCEHARANLNLLQSKYQVADSSGKPLDEQKRQELIDQAKQAIASCDKP